MEWKNKAQEIALSSINFGYKGGSYRGRGILRWQPEKGFEICAFVERNGPPLPPTTEFKSVSFEDRSQTTIWMRTINGPAALIPVVLRNRLDLEHEDRLQATVSRVMFVSRSPSSTQGKYHGGAIFAFKHAPILPSGVVTETRIEGEKVRSNFEYGIRYESPGFSLYASYEEKTRLVCHWTFDNALSKHRSWRYSEGLKDAFSMLSGQTVVALQREVYRSHKHFKEVSKQEDIQDLGYLWPLGRDRIINLSRLLHLANFFSQDSSEADVARKIFNQVAEASRQDTKSATELLTASLLEAALRTLYGYPFKRKDKSFSIGRTMKQFRKDYLGDDWEAICNQVLGSWGRLRDKNAHPDWLTSLGGGLSLQKRSEDFDDLVRLGYFYGIMVLALARAPLPKPQMPAPTSDWKPMMTIHRYQPASGESIPSTSAPNPVVGDNPPNGES